MSGELVGREAPRRFTEPRRPLTRHTSAGFEVIEFAGEMLGVQLLPWQRWWLLHALELNPGGGFRFRTIVTQVARQNGKTFLLVLLALAFMYLGRVRLVLGAAQSLDIAREAWQGSVAMAEADAELREEIATVRRANGEQELRLTNGARYRITAATRQAGRGLSTDLLLLDELREHRDWLAWAALSKTTMARPNALTCGFSNAGDDQSVVLNNLLAAAVAGGDDSLALFDYSAPDGCALDDRDAIAQANPALGHPNGISLQAVLAALRTDPPAVYRTEVLCQKVDALDTAVDLSAWKACADPGGSLTQQRDQVVACLDVAPDGAHVTLAAAARLDDGRVRVEIVAAWPTTERCRDELAELLQRVNPVATAWFPTGPAAALAPVLRSQPGQVEITGRQVPEACMGFADLIAARDIVHPGDPLLDAHAGGAGKLPSGDGWRFSRNGQGHVDAAYAAAGATHVLLTQPVQAPAPRSVIF